MPDFVPVIVLDFDGVIHSFERGWQGGTIYGGVVLGFFEWAEQTPGLFDLVVYSSRSETRIGIDLMRGWLVIQFGTWCEARGQAYEATMLEEGDSPSLTLARVGGSAFTLRFPASKPAAWLTIDDRAIRFRGDWEAPELEPDQLRAFKSWVQLPPQEQ